MWSDGDEEVGLNDTPFIPAGIAVPALAPGQSFTAHYTVQSPPNVHGTLNVGLFADALGQTPQDNTAGEAASATLNGNLTVDVNVQALDPLRGADLSGTRISVDSAHEVHESGEDDTRPGWWARRGPRAMSGFTGFASPVDRGRSAWCG